MSRRLSKEQKESIKRFESIMSVPPSALVIRCCRCNKLVETTEVSDPMLSLQPLWCIELGSSCETEARLGPNAQPTQPAFIPGTFVIVTKDEQHYLPGMIDYIPEKHPLFMEKRPSPFGDGRLVDSYHVSLLNSSDQEYASDWYYIHQISPLERKHIQVMPNGEAREKHGICMEMERGDIRRRLYRFSYMAHKYGLKSLLPPEARRIPIRHGSLVGPGPTTRDLFVNIIPDLSEAGNVDVERFTFRYEGPPTGTPEAEEYLADLQQGSRLHVSIIDREDSPPPPPGH